MIVNLSEAASNVMLDAIAAMMDGGTIELLSSNGTPLAVLRLSNPAAGDAVDGALAFNKIAEGDAVIDGRAEFARVVASDGSEVFSCDVGDENSDVVIKLNTTKIKRDTGVKLSQFRLIMP
jgi:hypothetical protein